MSLQFLNRLSDQGWHFILLNSSYIDLNLEWSFDTVVPLIESVISSFTHCQYNSWMYFRIKVGISCYWILQVLTLSLPFRLRCKLGKTLIWTTESKLIATNKPAGIVGSMVLYLWCFTSELQGNCACGILQCLTFEVFTILAPKYDLSAISKSYEALYFPTQTSLKILRTLNTSEQLPVSAGFRSKQKK